jgi:hypothetical protein
MQFTKKREQKIRETREGAKSKRKNESEVKARALSSSPPRAGLNLNRCDNCISH